jgi:hypothetical protein
VTVSRPAPSLAVPPKKKADEIGIEAIRIAITTPESMRKSLGKLLDHFRRSFDASAAACHPSIQAAFRALTLVLGHASIPSLARNAFAPFRRIKLVICAGVMSVSQRMSMG